MLALASIATAVAAVRFVDIAPAVAGPTQAATVSEPLSTPLPLPASTADNPDPTPAAAADTVAAELQSAVAPQPAEPPASVAETAESILVATIAPAVMPEESAAETAVAGTIGEADDTAPSASIAEEAQAPAAEPQAKTRWVEHRVESGESLARIFAGQDLSPNLLHRIVNSGSEAASLSRIRPGQVLRFQFDENDELVKLELQRSRVESLRIAIADDEIRSEEISKAVEHRVASAAGVIESSLFVDAQKAGMSDGQIMELATVFGWDIDFALEIRAGDQFRVLFEEDYLEGEKLRNGPILAAEFTNRGTTYRAVRYEDKDGETGYYTPDGQSKRGAFIRTPIRFARVSSRFNPRRWHPVLKKWRSHKGVDYAAPTGTPVKATGDGRIVFRGTKGGYGKAVIIEHGNKYTTLYGHLSGFSSRATSGNRVKQGQVIGYVGQTGLASGPHLHYEFRVNGQHQDPLTVKLPKALSLPSAEIPAFRTSTKPLLAQLDAVPAETMVASAPAEGHATP